MQARELRRLDKRLEGFLSQRTASMGRSERRHWAGVYVRGLLLEGERKSVEPMAAPAWARATKPSSRSSTRVPGPPTCCSMA